MKFELSGQMGYVCVFPLGLQYVERKSEGSSTTSTASQFGISVGKRQASCQTYPLLNLDVDQSVIGDFSHSI